MIRTDARVLIAAVCAVLLSGCFPKMTVRVPDETVGFNGGFETTREELPVNWYLYWPRMESGDYEIHFDEDQVIEGNQSLRFVVQHADGGRGWSSPGLFQVTDAKELRAYRVSFWIRNEGTEATFLIRSENPSVSAPASPFTLTEEETGLAEWKRFEYVYAFPKDYHNIRFEMDILRPGTFWIDDVRIQEEPNATCPDDGLHPVPECLPAGATDNPA